MRKQRLRKRYPRSHTGTLLGQDQNLLSGRSPSDPRGNVLLPEQADVPHRRGKRQPQDSRPSHGSLAAGSTWARDQGREQEGQGPTQQPACRGRRRHLVQELPTAQGRPIPLRSQCLRLQSVPPPGHLTAQPQCPLILPPGPGLTIVMVSLPRLLPFPTCPPVSFLKQEWQMWAGPFLPPVGPSPSCCPPCPMATLPLLSQVSSLCSCSRLC